MMDKHLRIFDTTLRDGEQSPGASMTTAEKIRIAKLLEKMKVDIIEAGFAAASPGDFDAVSQVASVIKDSTVCSLARAIESDVRKAGESIRTANSGRIHTFLATSAIHMESKLLMTPDEVVENATKAVKLARQYTDNVEFSPEDAGRSDPEFLCRVIESAIDAGATTINIPDTVGYTLPDQFGGLFKYLIANIPNSDKAVFSAHTHNDLGLAVANALAAVQNGARQVECTVNGLGERAGNTSLEEVVMAVRTRNDQFECDTRIDTTQIVPVSRLVSSITGFPVQPNKAIVGANAFAHEAGIHQDGMLKNPETYEIMRAEDVGWNANRMVLGKHSGRNAFAARLKELGVEFETQEELNEMFKKFKELADKKHEIFDEDLHVLVSDTEFLQADERLKLISMHSSSETGKIPTATVTISFDGEEHTVTSSGDGQVDASFKAIENVVQHNAELVLYSVNAITSGTDAQGEVTVRLEKEGRVVNGNGADVDIVIASAKAYINAINHLVSPMKKHPQLSQAV